MTPAWKFLVYSLILVYGVMVVICASLKDNESADGPFSGTSQSSEQTLEVRIQDTMCHSGRFQPTFKL